MKNVISVFLIIISMVLVIVTVKAQTIQGKVIENKSYAPIAFVNIGIPDKGIGTVSDIDGSFKLDLTNLTEDQLILFSIIGYEKTQMRISELNEYLMDSILVIKLKEKSFQLDEVVINPKKWKHKIIGNETTTQRISFSFLNNNLGNEFGTKMKIRKNKDTYLEEFNFSIAYNKCDSLYFRLNIYDIEDGYPNNNLLKQNIIIKTNIKNGVVSVDLSPYQIYVQDDIIVSLEWLRDLCSNANSELGFSASLFGNAYDRSRSFEGWGKISVATPGMWMKVRYEQ